AHVTSLLIIGATGAVGSRTLTAALADERVDRVFALGRRTLPEHPKLDARVVDFDTLDTVPPVDAVVCALGTTRRDAETREAYRRIDHDIVVRVAELAREAGATTCALVSSLGANPASRTFYLRLKGEVEESVRRVGFESVTIVRPSGLVGGERTRKNGLGDRLVEASAVIGPLVPARYRPVHVDRVAAVLLDAVLSPEDGIRIRESETL
ncbi:MAG TPA: NAD(P)H-binding protein, partial [Nocardioides sp.]